MKTMRDCVKLMRVRHYIKNLLVFAALGCSGQLFHMEKLAAVLAGFAAFCALSSAIYTVNDIQDAERDRLHPVKRNRPVASGRVSVKTAWLLAAALLAASALFHVLTLRPGAAALLALYAAMNLAYSFGLKNVPLVDVVILSGGFLVRVIYGAMVADVAISNWLYLTVVNLALYFSLGKRRNELRRVSAGATRKVLEFYSVDFLDKGMQMCLTLANAFYALWCMDGATIARYGASPVFTVLLVLLITLRYSMDVEGESDGDPAEVLLGDRVLVALCLVWFLTLFISLYF